MVKCLANTMPKHFEIFDEFALDNQYNSYSDVISSLVSMKHLIDPNTKFELLTKMKG